MLAARRPAVILASTLAGALACSAAESPKEQPVEASPPAEVDAPAPRATIHDDVAQPLAAILGKSQAEVAARLGAGKPSRTWDACHRQLVRPPPSSGYQRFRFRCARQRVVYPDPSGTFLALRVEFEDDKATAIRFEGINKDGSFSVAQALRVVGLELPGDPPAREISGRSIWRWMDHEAGLRIDGRAYRVDVTVPGDNWRRCHVEVMVNDTRPDELDRSIE